MKCPQCGNEVAGGKFCGSCGAPMEAAVAFQPQPYPYPQPAPMPPQKKSLAWLWITLGVVGAAAVLGIAAFVLLGGPDLPEGPAPNPGPSAGPTTDPSVGPAASASADVVLKSYLDLRKAGDMAAAYKLLSTKARETYTQAEYEGYYKDHVLVSFGHMEVVPAKDPWVEVVVHDFKAGDSTLGEAPFMLVKESGGFRVALEVPLNARMDRAFEAKAYDEAEKLAGQMEAINPKSYYAQFNRGWAQMERKQYQQAVAPFEAAIEYAIAEDKPDAVRSLGLAYANLNQWDAAAQRLEEAIGLLEPFADLYDIGWRQQLLGDLAIVYEKAGMLPEAIDLLEVIYKADPKATVNLEQAGRLERKPYKVVDGWATYKLMKHGISFALPQGWVISNETTGGDWWFARHPDSPAIKTDLAVYIHGDYLGKTMEEAIAGVLKRYQEPIGAPKRDVSIINQDTFEINGHTATGLLFSDNTVSVLMKVGESWIDFHWFYNPVAQQDLDDWSETIEVTW
ncbi:MAG TPA: hypothetical protein VD973_29005 [Symbiobacteriaceae bacterium]|nr:hypothetical protein [Symbiobacteriaceae bacterium]